MANNNQDVSSGSGLLQNSYQGGLNTEGEDAGLSAALKKKRLKLLNTKRVSDTSQKDDEKWELYE